MGCGVTCHLDLINNYRSDHNETWCEFVLLSKSVTGICLALTQTASGDVCHLLITFANSLDPDQDRQYVGPDLDPNHLIVFLK